MIDFTIDASSRCVAGIKWNTTKIESSSFGRSDYARRCGGNVLFIRSQYNGEKTISNRFDESKRIQSNSIESIEICSTNLNFVFVQYGMFQLIPYVEMCVHMWVFVWVCVCTHCKLNYPLISEINPASSLFLYSHIKHLSTYKLLTSHGIINSKKPYSVSG